MVAPPATATIRGASGGWRSHACSEPGGLFAVDLQRLRIDRHAVVAPCRLQAHLFVQHVLADALWVALERIAVSAATRLHVAQGVAAGDRHREFARQKAGLPLRIEDVAGGVPGLAPGQPPGAEVAAVR